MKTTEFLARVLPEGYHYVAYPMEERVNGRPIMGHRVFETPQEGVNIAKGMLDKDVYFATGGFAQGKILDPKRGFMKSYRKQSNVSAMRSLYLDIDFKNYDSPEQTIRKFSEFRKENELPKPTIIVNSGGGVHVYWTMDRDMPPDEWKSLATGLARMAQKHKLRADLQCTIDSARILRLPGTKNYKYGDPVKCHVSWHRDDDCDPEEMRKALHHVTASSDNVAGLRPSAEVIDLFKHQKNDDLKDGYDNRLAYHMSRLVNQCPTMADIVARRGAGDSYGTWKNALHLAAFTEDGEEYIDAISDGYEGYSAEEARDKFDESMRAREAGEAGPTTCNVFSNESSKCAECQFFGKIKSPIVLGRPERSTQKEPDPSYVLNGATYRNKLTEDENGEVTMERELVCGSAVTDWEYVKDSGGNKFLCMTVDIDGTRTLVEVTPETQTDPKVLRRELMRSGLVLQAGEVKKFEEVMTSWRHKLNREAAHSGDRPPFGWVVENGKPVGYAMCGKLYKIDGTIERAGVVDSGLKKVFAPTGTAEPWYALARKIGKDPRPEAHIMVAASMAAPFMRFGEANSFTLSCYSRKSGAGKSTLLRFTQAMWGHPINSGASLNDTANSIIHRMARQRDMPMAWDEMRQEENIKNFVTILFQNTQGKSKSRLSASAEIKESYEINSMMLVASNDPLIPAVREAAELQDAGILRMFELNLPMVEGVDLEYGELLAELNQNYGVVGEKWAAICAKDLERVKSDIREIRMNIGKKWGEKRSERFWFAAASTILATAVLAARHDIISLDLRAMKERLKAAIEHGRSQVQEVEVAMSNTLASVAFENQQSVLVTDHRKGRGHSRMDVKILRAPHLVTKVHITRDNDELVVPESVIKEFCQKRSMSFTHVQQYLKQDMGLKPHRITMGAGTQYSAPRMWCYVVSARQTIGEDIMTRWASDTEEDSAST